MLLGQKLLKTALENLGFYNVWLNQGVEFLSLIFEQRMGDNYLQDWNSEIGNSSRAKNI